DRAAAVDWVSEWVDDPSDQGIADRPTGDAAGPADRLALLDLVPLAEQGGADVVLLEVQRDAGDAVLQLEHLEGDGALQAVDAGDAVSDLQPLAHLRQVGLDVEVLDPLLQQSGDLFGA